jgi:hypothetical protein
MSTTFKKKTTSFLINENGDLGPALTENVSAAMFLGSLVSSVRWTATIVSPLHSARPVLKEL